MISTIIPVYNQADKIGRTFDSLLKQTEQDFEVIVVDDASTDDIAAVLAAYQGRFRRWQSYCNEINQRIASIPRNRGLRHAQGDYILWLDADLEMRPEMLARMKALLDRQPEVDFVYCSHYFGRKLFRFRPFRREDFLAGPCIHTSSMIRRAAVPAGGWDESLRRLQDWDLFLRAVLSGSRGHFIDEVLFTYQPGGIMSKWLPGFFYKYFPFLSLVKDYQAAVKKVKEKNGLL